jgi:DNA-directed RNA polymerase specialized sigma24 family protein
MQPGRGLALCAPLVDRQAADDLVQDVDLRAWTVRLALGSRPAATARS